MNNLAEKIASCPDLMARAEAYHQLALQRLSNERRSELGQFMTPVPLARYMASLFDRPLGREVRLLDAGAGVGTLAAAFVENLSRGSLFTPKLSLTVYELDDVLSETLHALMDDCAANCEVIGQPFKAEVLEKDFLFDAGELLAGDLFRSGLDHAGFTHAILHPPFKKISGRCDYRPLMSRLGIETNNLYSAFLGLTIKLLEPGGELVALVPRSFCNGPSFLPFRRFLLAHMSLRQIHLFERSDQAFAEDDVLQENLILHAVKDLSRGQVALSVSRGPELEDLSLRLVSHDRVVNPYDSQRFIHVASSELDSHVMERMGRMAGTLNELGLDVSTGQVIEFRFKELLRSEPEEGCVPMIYPTNFESGCVRWPNPASRKPKAIVDDPFSDKVLLANDYYTLVRRFSTKEERHRLSAVVYDPKQLPGEKVGIENHINVIHAKKREMGLALCKGLTIYLNSTLVDMYFRQFNGHTQVNAADLKALPFPSREQLEQLGEQLGEVFPEQVEIDAWLESLLSAQRPLASRDPTSARRRLDEARDLLRDLEVKSWSQEVSALTLLALAELEPERPWSGAQAVWLDLPRIMTFCRDTYGRAYVPWRRDTEHWPGLKALLAADLVDYRQGAGGEPHYRLCNELHTLVCHYGQPEWKPMLNVFPEGLREE